MVYRLKISYRGTAYAGWQRLRAGQHEELGFTIRPRWPMQELVAG